LGVKVRKVTVEPAAQILENRLQQVASWIRRFVHDTGKRLGRTVAGGQHAEDRFQNAFRLFLSWFPGPMTILLSVRQEETNWVRP
jgi:hypothetical protein